MNQKHLWCGVLIVALSMALATPARADRLQAAATGVIVGIVVVGVAIAVTVTVVILHEKSKKRAITGCVRSGSNRMTVTDEKSGQTYELTGDTTHIKPGDRMRLRGNKEKLKGTDKLPVWNATEVTKDLGLCQL